ncbi:MAG: 4-(cytidine 5'-diphospho)-2-C-methyl-D-erythritol kinase [Rhodoferax sp.]
MRCLLDIPAPAKLNLFLHITGRRADGYHELQSVFALIDWCDTLHFELRTDGQLSREDLGTPLPPDDLVLRAARLLQARCGVPLGAHIGVDKQVPAEAGMGGGSSDAASCLLALNRLWNLGLPQAELCRIGLALGADVPFFIAGRNAWVEGIGDILMPITLPSERYVVVKPPQGLATARIFSDPDLKRNSNTATLSGFAADPKNFGCNDLQEVAQRHCSGIAQALGWLQTQGLRGRMTGSGSAVFAWADRSVDLASVPPGFRSRLCSGLENHPLVGWAQSE